MFDVMLTVDQALGGLLALLWSVAALRVGRLPSASPGVVARRARRMRRLILAALAVVSVKVVTVVVLLIHGYHFAAPSLWVELPLLLPPAAAVVLVTLPQLRLLVPDGDAAPPGRSAVVALQVTALGALLVAWSIFFVVPGPPYYPSLLRLAAVSAVAAVLLWWWRGLRVTPLRGRARVASTVVVVAAIAAATVGAGVMSRLPERLPMTGHHDLELGGGPAPAAAHGAAHGPGMSGEAGSTRDVRDLTGPRDGPPDVRYTLTGSERTMRLTSGAVVQARTFNGSLPGPPLRAREGDLVEVTLRNELPAEGLTVHWHGYDVPNAEDGVAGMTQDAVPPGGSHVYRFRAEQVGTFWYHAHQASSTSVRRGLFGALVVLPRDEPPGVLDMTVLSHSWPTDRGLVTAFGVDDGTTRRTVAPGTPVRLRLVNADTELMDATGRRSFALAGVPFRVRAIDGVDVVDPGLLRDVRVGIARGGRTDLEFTMPARPVSLTDADEPGPGLLLTPDGSGTAPATAVPAAEMPMFDPAGYGRAAPVPFDAGTPVDRDFTLVLGDRFGFYDGAFADWSTINGASFPDTPVLGVGEGELVRTTIVNRSHETHPMHLHGHHALVLSRNGRPTTGSPWWTDTLDVVPGETYEITFRADNPGLWMDHCHNLEHAAGGMTLHIAYFGVTSPFEVGDATGNRPE